MLLRKLTCLHLWILICVSLFSQVKTLQAVKTTAPPKIDGVLDDSAWNEVPVASDFIQNFPHLRSAGFAKNRSQELFMITQPFILQLICMMIPALIRKQITARDEEQSKDLDYFSVFFDTYNDHQNGFQFLVTSSNVQTDARLSPGISTGFW